MYPLPPHTNLSGGYKAPSSSIGDECRTCSWALLEIAFHDVDPNILGDGGPIFGVDITGCVEDSVEDLSLAPWMELHVVEPVGSTSAATIDVERNAPMLQVRPEGPGKLADVYPRIKLTQLLASISARESRYRMMAMERKGVRNLCLAVHAFESFFLARPRGRRVDSSPNRAAMGWTHAGLPNGRPPSRSALERFVTYVTVPPDAGLRHLGMASPYRDQGRTQAKSPAPSDKGS